MATRRKKPASRRAAWLPFVATSTVFVVSALVIALAVPAILRSRQSPVESVLAVREDAADGDEPAADVSAADETGAGISGRDNTVDVTGDSGAPDYRSRDGADRQSGISGGGYGTVPRNIEPEGSTYKAAEDTKGPRQARRPHRGTLVVVLDDAGHNTWQLQPFLELDMPLTVAVLPGLPYTRQAVDMIREAGKELILHQPMEAIDGLDPGPGAIRTDMDDGTIRSILKQNLAQVPGAVGMNNHMGSKATADVRVVSTWLDEAERAGLYVLDSLTVGDSVVHSTASLMRQSAWERTVFLDNTPDRASMLKYIAEGARAAEKRGYAIMIGHVWSAELAQTLADLYPQLVEQGFSFSTISRIMMDKEIDDDSGY